MARERERLRSVFAGGERAFVMVGAAVEVMVKVSRRSEGLVLVGVDAVVAREGCETPVRVVVCWFAVAVSAERGDERAVM